MVFAVVCTGYARRPFVAAPPPFALPELGNIGVSVKLIFTPWASRILPLACVIAVMLRKLAT